MSAQTFRMPPPPAAPPVWRSPTRTPDGPTCTPPPHAHRGPITAPPTAATTTTLPSSARLRRSSVQHPGVWEDGRAGYLNELLVRRVGHPAALAVLYADVMARLLARGAVDFAVAMDVR